MFVTQGVLTPRLVTAATLPLANKRLSGLPLEAGQKAAAALASWRARRGVALDITALPGMDLLSSKVSACVCQDSIKSIELLCQTLVFDMFGYLSVKGSSRLCLLRLHQ